MNRSTFITSSAGATALIAQPALACPLLKINQKRKSLIPYVVGKCPGDPGAPPDPREGRYLHGYRLFGVSSNNYSGAGATYYGPYQKPLPLLDGVSQGYVTGAPNSGSALLRTYGYPDHRLMNVDPNGVTTLANGSVIYPSAYAATPIVRFTHPLLGAGVGWVDPVSWTMNYKFDSQVNLQMTHRAPMQGTRRPLGIWAKIGLVLGVIGFLVTLPAILAGVSAVVGGGLVISAGAVAISGIAGAGFGLAALAAGAIDMMTQSDVTPFPTIWAPLPLVSGSWPPDNGGFGGLGGGMGGSFSIDDLLTQ